MTFFLAAGRPTPTNVSLLEGLRSLDLRAELVHPGELRHAVRSGDIVLGRVDVLPTLDGVESCLWGLRKLEGQGVHLLNGIGTLLASHDKLTTALRLGRAGVPHPRTVHLDERTRAPALEPPLVLKPRFGSWGRDVTLCRSGEDVEDALRRLGQRRWFRRHGVLVQELLPTTGRDLRLIVASGELVGAVERVAASGEWRTNVSLGAARLPVEPPEEARRIALAAAQAVGGDFIGVDLVADANGDYVVLELNGAVELTTDYSFPGRDVFADAARLLAARVAPVMAAAPA